jgi:hypothetical protein
MGDRGTVAGGTVGGEKRFAGGLLTEVKQDFKIGVYE